MDDVAPEYRQLHDTVLEQLGSDIVTGALPAGTRISADDVVVRFSVSRTVAREAVRVLESLGLLQVRRKAGITVLGEQQWNVLDPKIIRWQLAGPNRLDQLARLTELRSAIEPLAASLAATHATPAQCGALTAAVIGMSSTSRAADSTAYLQHDVDFHQTLLAASGNPLLRAMAAIVAEVLHGRTRHALMPHEANPGALQLHADVAAAVHTGDSAAAAQAMRAIVEESAAAVEQAGTPLAPPK